MKKKREILFPFGDEVRLRFRKMKLTVLLTFLVIASFGSGFSQVTLSLHFDKATIHEVLGSIEKKTDYIFMYKDDIFNSSKAISVDFEDAKFEEVLKSICEQSNVDYEVRDRQIILKERVNLPMPLAEQQPQKKEISGTVKDSQGLQLPGVNVVVKGTTIGVVTDIDGKYIISVPDASSILEFSFIGMKSQQIAVNGITRINVELASETVGINEVVVTALGIEKSSKSITYGTQTVSGEAVEMVPQTNFMNSLEGKVAGLTVSSSASGVGGSVKVLLRGNKSAQGNNQPLYVIDGVPLVNNPKESPTSFGNTDFGDGISNLNPDDIESVTVLKGASSAALYGSQAANGVILITTKKGKVGVLNINLSSSTTFDNVAYTPKLQNSYGQSGSGSDFSWGAPLNSKAKDQILDYFKPGGSTHTNAISLSSGTEKGQTYLSYSNTMADGVIPNNSLVRHNFNVHTTSNYFSNKLSIDVNANFILQTLRNPPTSGQQMTSLWGLYLFPRGLEFNSYKNNYEVFDPVRKLMTQNWWRTPDVYIQNPYWVNNKILNVNQLSRTVLKVSAKYKINDWINIQVRGNVDKSGNVTTSEMYVGTPVVIAGVNGSYSITDINNTQYYADAILNFNKIFNKIKLNGLLGSSIMDTQNQGEYHSSSALYIANVFNLQNMDPTNGNTSFGSISPAHSQLQSVFGSLNLSYNNWLFLDMTGRNDWSSNLSFTPNVSYFYPSAGMSAVLQQVLKLPEIISYAKIRGSYAIVGNTVPNYVTNPINFLSKGGNIKFNTTAPFNELNPEKTKSLEIGSELRFLKDKLRVDFDYYKTNTTNQFFSISVPPGTGYSQRFINGGNIQNSGIELALGYDILSSEHFKWNSLINFSTNKNVVKELSPKIDQFVLDSGDLNNFFSILKVGGSYGDIYSVVWDRDSQGRLKIDATSRKPIVKSGNPSLVGNANPKFQMGWNNNFTYRNFALSFQIDGQFGSKIISVTQSALDNYGVSKASGDARDKGGVSINGVIADTNTPVSKIDAENYYRGRPYGECMFDGSVVRLREISIGYQLPEKILKNGFVKKVQLSIVGRNLIYFYKPAPSDSEITYSVGNAYSGLDAFALPPTSSLGFNLKVNF